MTQDLNEVKQQRMPGTRERSFQAEGTASADGNSEMETEMTRLSKEASASGTKYKGGEVTGEEVGGVTGVRGSMRRAWKVIIKIPGSHQRVVRRKVTQFHLYFERLSLLRPQGEMPGARMGHGAGMSHRGDLSSQTSLMGWPRLFVLPPQEPRKPRPLGSDSGVVIGNAQCASPLHPSIVCGGS